jgi:RND family efflux transporter MFP subunit
MNESGSQFSHKFIHRVVWGLSLLLIIAIIGIAFRIVEYIRLRRDTDQQSIPTVATIVVLKGPAREKLILPGNILAWHEATIFARTNGYLIKWYTDIGAHVRTGDLLAVISTPEVDSQLRQTEAQLKTAQANYKLAKITADRWKNLLKTNSVSQQDTDERVSNEKAQAAIVASTIANRDRLRDLVSFQKVIAPFDGVIMSRTTDIGRLINAGSNGSVPLFRIVQYNPLRVYVRVPQIFSTRIRPGLTGELHFSQHPEKVYPAKLLDTARAIDARTRTLLIQLKADNPENELFSGSYAEVHLIIPSQKNAVLIPVNTLVFQSKGLQVATVTDTNHAVLKSIRIGRDFGDTVEVIEGLIPGERIILNPPDSLTSGQTVRLVSSSQLTNKGN